MQTPAGDVIQLLNERRQRAIENYDKEPVICAIKTCRLDQKLALITADGNHRVR